MYQPSPLADAIEKSVREIARRNGVSLRQAAEIWKAEVHRRAEEISRQRNRDRN